MMSNHVSGICIGDMGPALVAVGYEKTDGRKPLYTTDHAEELAELLIETHNKLAAMTDLARKLQAKHLGSKQGDVYHAMQYLASSQGLRHTHTKKVQLALTNYREATK
jgi:hypothetical protein